jgi:uncharacterized protein YndB with AHSA1/START domain
LARARTRTRTDPGAAAGQRTNRRRRMPSREAGTTTETLRRPEMDPLANMDDTPPSFADTVAIAAPVDAVWAALTRTECMGEWMGEPAMAIEVETDWRVGHPIVVRGSHSAPFVNTGVVLAFEPAQALSYSHLSSLSDLPPHVSSYTTLSFRLGATEDGTRLDFAAMHFPTASIFKHLRFYWSGTLPALKQYVESRYVDTGESES